MKKIYLFLLGVIWAFAVNAQSVFIVNDDNVKEGEFRPIYEAVLNSGFTVDTFNFAIDTVDLTYEQLQSYSMVIWYIGNDRMYLNLWDTAVGYTRFHPALQQYYENQNGAIWIDGLDIPLTLIKQTTGETTDFDVEKPVIFDPAQGTRYRFIHDTLGIAEWNYESYTDDGGSGVPEMDVADGNNIITLLNPIQWQWSTLWRADGWTPVDGAVSLYVLGPSSYDGAGYVSFFKYENNGVKLYVSSVRTGVIGDGNSIVQTNINKFVASVLADAVSSGPSKVEQNQDLRVNVYPNPVAEDLFVNTNAAQAELVITDLAGKTVYSAQLTKSVVLNVSDWQSGVYTVKISSDKGVYTTKIIVK